MYKKQWNILNSVTGQSDLTTLQVDKAKLYLTDTYTSRLRSDGVSKEDVLATLSEITDLVKNTPDDGSRQSHLAKELEKSLPEVQNKVEVSYNV